MIGLGILLTILAILIYIVAIKPYSFWRDRNVKNVVIPFFGDNFNIVFGLESFADQVVRIYNRFSDERYYGTYFFTRPILVLRTPDIIKKLCVKDFDHFLNRREFVGEDTDILFSRNLLGLKGQAWKDMRSIISPTFTTSKMKAMFVLICQNAKLFTQYFLEKNEDIIEVEFKDVISRFSTDVIASSAFGVQIDSLKDRENEFYKIGKEGVNFGSIRMKIASVLYQLSPKIAALLQVSMIPSKVQDFIINFVKDSLKMREEKQIKRPDVLGLLLEARKGALIVKEKEEEEGGFAVVQEHLEMKNTKCDLSDQDIAAQAFVFFLAGFEGVATLISLAVYELTINPDVQKKLRDEIDANWPENNEPSYNLVMRMTYLDMVVSETLRKWPNGVVTDRVVTKKYTIEPERPGEKEIVLEEGTILLVPILGLHMDPKYFPNPNKFDPERFSPENTQKIDPYTYIPFGVGPRNCVGSRFALMEVKTLLFYLLHHFELVPIDKTQIPMKFNKNAFGFIPEKGFHVGLKKIP